MATLLQVGTDAMTDLGELGQGQSPNTSEQAMMLRAANRVLESWALQGLMIYAKSERTLSLSGQASFTHGPSGSLGGAVSRPVLIESAKAVIATAVKLPVNMLDLKGWGAVRDETATGAFPTDIYVNYTAPDITVHVHPKSSAGLELYCWAPFTAFSAVSQDLVTQVGLPTGYERALKWALTAELAPGFDKPVTPEIKFLMDQAVQAVMAINAQTLGGSINKEQQMRESPNVGNPLPIQAGGPQ